TAERVPNSLVIVTLTPGSSAPDSSLATPYTLPVAIWAMATPERAKTSPTARARILLVTSRPPSPGPIASPANALRATGVWAIAEQPVCQRFEHSDCSVNVCQSSILCKASGLDPEHLIHPARSEE